MGCLFAPKPLYRPQVHSSALVVVRRRRADAGRRWRGRGNLLTDCFHVSCCHALLDHTEVWVDIAHLKQHLYF